MGDGDAGVDMGVAADEVFAAEGCGEDFVGDSPVGRVDLQLGEVGADGGFLVFQMGGDVGVEVYVFGRDAVVAAFGWRQGHVKAFLAEEGGLGHPESTGTTTVEEALGGVGLYVAGKLMREGLGVCGLVEGGGRVVAHGDVVGMTVEAIGAEGEDDMGAEAADLGNEGLDDFLGGDVDEGAGMVVGLIALHAGVAVVEDDRLLEAQGAAGGFQFFFTNLREGLTGGRAGLADLTLVTQRGADQADIYSPLSVAGEGASDGEGFIVGMGEANEHSITAHGLFLIIFVGNFVTLWATSMQGGQNSIAGVVRAF